MKGSSRDFTIKITVANANMLICNGAGILYNLQIKLCMLKLCHSDKI